MPTRTGLYALLAATLIALAAPLPLRAQPETGVRALLDSLFQEIDAANPSVLAARLDAQAHRARGAQASAWPDPTASAAVMPFPILTARGAQGSQWRVEQPIPYPGKRKLNRQIAEQEALAAEADAAGVLEDAVLQLKQAVYDLLHIQALTLWIDEFEGLLEGFEDAAATQYAVGRGSQAAVLRAQLEHNALGRLRLQYAGRERSALAAVARALNRPGLDSLALPVPDAPSSTVDALVEAQPPADPEAALRIARQARPEFRELRLTRLRNDLEVDLAHREFRPDFGLHLTYTDIRAREMLPLGNGRDALMIGTGLKIPLNRGRLRAGVREAEVRGLQTDARLEALEARVEAEIRDLTAQLDLLREERALLRELLLPQAELTLEATRSAYSTGRTDFLSLLDAERALFQLRLDEVAAGARLLQTRAALERALGVRWIDDPLPRTEQPDP